MKKFLLFFVLSAVLAACGSDDGGGGTEDDGPMGDAYNRTAMLTYWANNIIKPGYADMAVKSEELKATATAFTDNPNATTLQDVRAKWLAAYKQFQRISMFEIGKAEELRLRLNMNTYPTDVELILEDKRDPEVDLGLPSKIDSQGFPAIEFLLYGVGNTEEDIISFYSTDADAADNTRHLLLLATRIDNLIDEVNDDWQGNYANTFISNSGSSATSSVNKVANDFMFYYEKSLRAGKVGIPAGVFSDETLPNKVECLYESNSAKAMLLEALDASVDFFNGSKGFADYLNHLNVQRNGQPLATIINNQFDAAEAQINTLGNDLKAEVETNNTNMLTTYDELQKNVVYLKVDMMQALNIAIDYVDADGD